MPFEVSWIELEAPDAVDPQCPVPVFAACDPATPEAVLDEPDGC